MTWLFLTLSHSGWGEAVLALRIARRLVARGDRVVVLTHPLLGTLFEGEPVTVVAVGEERGPAVEALVHRLLKEHRPVAIVLADLLLAATALGHREANASLARTGLPVIGIDTWHFREIGGALDLRPDGEVRLSPHLVNHPRRLVPVPFVRPGVPGAALVLPEGTVASAPARAATRAKYGLPQGPLVAMATAGWQQRRYGSAAVTRLQQAVPELLGAALARLDVVQVGPVPLPLPGANAVHLPALPAPAFEELLGSADLLLATNASASTNATAVVRGVPVVTVVHDRQPDPDLPYAFRAWPIGLSRTLGTLLADNLWAEVLHLREIREPDALRATIDGLLPGGRDRDAGLHRAAAVRTMLRDTPLPEDVLDRLARQ